MAKTTAAGSASDTNVILEALAKINDRLDALEKPVETVAPPVGTGHPPVIANSAFPVPQDYLDIVHTVLNARFGTEIVYQTDAAAFELSILVPRDYSNAPKPHWETYKEDRRSRVILNALGANGVREWANLVYNNFDMETRARIIHDRSITN